MNILDKYRIINKSYKKKLIFHLGAEAGFYSEFNNMVAAILYCLKYEYKFILYSKDANFGYANGWTDYFLPFCSETTFFAHKIFNGRTHRPHLNKKELYLLKLYKIINKNTYLTYELWDRFYCEEFDKELFDIPRLGIYGNLRESSAIITHMIYRFNLSISRKIFEYKKNIWLPKEYISMQIRRGDKNTEWLFLPIENYFNRAALTTSCRNVYVLTDDFDIIEQIEILYPQWKIYTLTENTENGYYHSDFTNLPRNDVRNRIIKLFASLEIIKHSSCFIGTFTTNVGLFVGMTMPFDKVISIQKVEWFQFSKEDVKQYEIK